MMIRKLAEMTRNDVRQAARTAIAVLPIGSQEQHADHLPMGTDTILVETVLQKALEQFGDGPPDLVLLPTLPYGFSDHHLFSAAVSLSPRTHQSVLSDIFESLTASGFRRILIVNGHGGNQETMALAIKQHSLAHDVVMGACSYWLASAGEGVENPDLTPGHAGWFETSLMLAAQPDLVRHSLISTDTAEEPPLFDNPPIPGLIVERHGEWARVGGSTDPASHATATDGHVLLDHRVSGLVGAIAAFDNASHTHHGNAP